MNFLGDYFSLAVLMILCMVYFDRKPVQHSYSKYYVLCLVFTALTAITDLLTMELQKTHCTIWGLNITVNSLYFLMNVLSSTAIAMFLFNRILEHSYEKRCKRRARLCIEICLSIYIFAIIANIWTGWLFYFDAQNNYQRGLLNDFGYGISLIYMVMVLICYHRYRRKANQSLRRAIMQAAPLVVLCIIIQDVYPNVMLNGFALSMIDTILFLNFQGQRDGVHELTRLNDRHRFYHDIELRIAEKSRFQVFLINLKNFGVINQKYGHLFGDETLYQFAFALEKLIKNSTAYHMNGTVFTLVLPYTDEKQAENYFERLLQFLDAGIDCIHDHVCLDYVAVEYTSSLDNTNAKEFYEELEYAAAKAYREKHRFIRWQPLMGDEMRRNRYLIDRMEKIDRAHGFRVWYQPICSLSNHEFTSVEALVRLEEPDGSIVSPAEFIPLAEESGMLALVTWFVLEEVCSLLAVHPELQFISVSINLPMAQLLERGFVDRLNDITRRHGIKHRCLCLEFTERAILENFDRTQDVMKQLTVAGYRFYLDDFGSGYSNFNCLMQLPFQFIKLDASLVRMDGADMRHAALVRNLTEIFHNMNLKVIAEGVETFEEAARLKKHGVDRIQGYVYAKPMPDDALLIFYEKRGVAIRRVS